MAQNYYTVEKAAEVLGVSVDEIRHLRESRELYGYRDGSTWKFKAEDVETLARRRSEGPSGDEDDDVLLSELALGGSTTGRSGKVASSKEGGSKAGSGAKKGSKSAAVSDDELTLDLEDEFTLADSGAGLAKKGKSKGKDSSSSDVVGDDELVLGGSGGGSDITLGADSGINLVDPADSGLSLEAPLQLNAGGEESLELGEDDMISLNDDGDSESPTRLKADEEFLLTPASDATDDDDESGSQVIALDSEGMPDDAATKIGSPSTAAMVAMLDEEGATPLSPLGSVPGMATAAAAMAAVAPSTLAAPAPETMIVEAALPETPYSGLQIAGLSVAAVLLVICGMMISEVVRTAGTWGAPSPIASSFMDKVLSMVDGGR